MSLQVRVLRAAVLVVLGLLALVFIGSDVTGCLGPLGRTFVQSIADGCTKPGIGIAVPIGVAFVLVAVLSLEWPIRRPIRHRVVIAASAAIVAVAAYLVARPTELTGPTSTGAVITVELPLDLAMVAVAALVAGGFGWVVSRWIRFAPFVAALLALAVVACGTYRYAQPTRPLGPGERWLPAFPVEMADGTPILCGGVGFIGNFVLHGAVADPRLAWIRYPDGSRRELVWPAGYSARFTPDLEVLDDHGQVVARDLSIATGGCPMPPDGAEWVSFDQPQPEPTAAPESPGPGASG